MVKTYTKKPIPVQALQWTETNFDEVKEFCPDVIYGACILWIKTLEGLMVAQLGDYIIKGVEGEFYPCNKEIFEKTYELVE